MDKEEMIWVASVGAIMIKKQKATEPTPDNPWCEACLEKDCILDDEDTCAMIRVYLRAAKESIEDLNLKQIEEILPRLMRIELMFAVQDARTIDKACNLLELAASEIRSLRKQVDYLERTALRV